VKAQLLLLDPAFRHFGWAVLRFEPKGEQIVAGGVFNTTKIDKKRKVLQSDDNHRCAMELAKGIETLINTFEPTLICAESQQGSKNAHAMQLQGMAWGVLSAVAALRQIPVLQATPQSVKKALCGRLDASKEAIQAAVLARYPDVLGLAATTRPPSLHEHIYDSVAVGITCLTSTEVQTIRQMSAR